MQSQLDSLRSQLDNPHSGIALSWHDQQPQGSFEGSGTVSSQHLWLHPVGNLRLLRPGFDLWQLGEDEFRSHVNHPCYYQTARVAWPLRCSEKLAARANHMGEQKKEVM